MARGPFIDVDKLNISIVRGLCSLSSVQWKYFNGAAVEVWEWISNFILHSTGHVIKLIHVSKMAAKSGPTFGQLLRGKLPICGSTSLAHQARFPLNRPMLLQNLAALQQKLIVDIIF